ncbi:MAG: RidA family protein [Bacteroidetes bacterium]|nr:RidA family protein [Bacteroidota bacterium]
MRQNISSGAKWEEIVGYSRAVRVGNLIEVSGTTAVDEDGNVVGENDYYTQTKFILKKIKSAIEQAEGKMENILRTRIFVKDITAWQEVAKAHLEFFKDIKPSTSMVEVSALIDKKLLVEIEATAIIS